MLGTGIEKNIINQALENFAGTWRRFQYKGDCNNVPVYDDYAHHPTEANVTLDGIRKGWDRRLIAIFQPHLYTRTRDFYEEFGKAFATEDRKEGTTAFLEKRKANFSGK